MALNQFVLLLSIVVGVAMAAVHVAGHDGSIVQVVEGGANTKSGSDEEVSVLDEWSQMEILNNKDLRGGFRRLLACTYTYKWQLGDTCQSVISKFCGMRASTTWQGCLGVKAGYCFGTGSNWVVNTPICVKNCFSSSKKLVTSCK